MTLVAAYERLLGGRGTEIKPGEPAPPIPVKLPVILHPASPAEPPLPPPRPVALATPSANVEEAAAERAKPQRRRPVRQEALH
jgi:hypothetical protein